jgi:hypothetical protein
MSREAMILEMVKALLTDENLDVTDEDQARDALAMIRALMAESKAK